jgi:hypothetical protein
MKLTKTSLIQFVNYTIEVQIANNNLLCKFKILSNFELLFQFGFKTELIKCSLKMIKQVYNFVVFLS